VQRAAASQKRINQFLNEKPDIISRPDSIRFQLQGTIEFRNVTFTYPDTGIQALKNVSFKLNKGEKLAIVGRTGAGKTTIAELLLRMYDVSEGVILIDGIDIRKLDLYDLRKQIGYVPQDVFLFSDTIENNIAFSESSCNGNVMKAAMHASVHHEIEAFKNHYQTIIGERGITLSGGQKQRIAIARAIIKNPSLIILDDCLSAVDAATERVILQNLKDLLQQKTAIIITHRISNMLDFDKIIVLDNGRISESGTHQELLNKKGFYYELFERQQSEESIAT
jgi:ATP-binding cassette subfamily B protein